MNRILEGKTVLIAGAGGIGDGLARRYAAEGAKVVLGDINLTTAEETVHAIIKGGGEAVAVQLDGADEQSISRTMALCQNTFGGLDGLHVNFACMADSTPEWGVLELPLEVFDEVLRVNARGFFLCTRAAVPLMIARGGGSIVYTTSAAAHAGGAAQLSYAMSKAAIQALMRHVATRYGAVGVRANAIAPAMTLHPRVIDHVHAEMIEWARSAAKIKSRVGRPDDIAAMGALLLSDDGSYITGQVICIDGGTTMRP